MQVWVGGIGRAHVSRGVSEVQMPVLSRRVPVPLSRRAFIACAAASGLGSRAVRAAAPIRFLLDWRIEGPTALLLAAEEKGHFRDEGLEVRFETVNGSRQAPAHLASGDFEAGYGDINALIVSLAGQGKHVVRLKGGDPGIFGRAGEEIEACAAAGIPVAIVPGISAAQGAAASLGLSLTHRDHARRLQFVTGHSRKGELPDDLDWRAMADPAASTVIYMARATLPGFREKALAAGLDPRTPAVAVLSATRPDEQRVAATIATLPERLAELSQPGPVLVLLGHAFGAALVATEEAADRRSA